MLLVSVDVRLVLASCYLYILACSRNYYRKKKKLDQSFTGSYTQEPQVAAFQGIMWRVATI